MRRRRIQRLRICRLCTACRLHVGKTWDSFEHDLVPWVLRRQLEELTGGNCVGRGVNVLAFGLPGISNTPRRDT